MTQLANSGYSISSATPDNFGEFLGPHNDVKLLYYNYAILIT